jgi:citronellol/citronellal dehydrogenase
MHALKGRNVLVTGASRGIGRAIAQRFAAEGASLVLSASRMGAHGPLEGSLEESVEQLQASGVEAAGEVANLVDAESRSDLIERAKAHFGPIDVLVNNAGGGRMTLPSKATTRERSMMFELNMNAPVDLAQQALPDMRARGGGWILNISSATAKQSTPPYRDTKHSALIIGPYGATKAALDRYTEALAHELAEDEIFVNALAPVAIVLTQGADYVRPIARKNPDLVEPVEMMAEAALELCTGRHVGRVVFSRDILHSVGRKVMSLDGQQLLGDAFLGADVEATA